MQGQQEAPARRHGVRLALLLVLVAVAYHHSLVVLAGYVVTDTPLAYLGLLPAAALAVALVKGRVGVGEPRLPHWHMDWIVGLPLLGVAAFVALVLPRRLSYEYWTDRLDLLGLPFFVAGLVALLYGTRMLWRVRGPVAALVLAWPLPWVLGMDRLVGWASAGTVRAVSLLAPVTGATREGASTVFSLGPPGEAFQVNVAPQCAGASSLLGFLLVGGAAMAVASGPRRRRSLWLLLGATLVYAVNVVRILLVLAVGDTLGQQAAMGWLHPSIGLVLLALTVAVLLPLAQRLGLTLLPARRALPQPAPCAPPPGRGPRQGALVTLLTVSTLLAASNQALAKYDPYLGVADEGAYRPVTISSTPALDGWSGSRTARIDWATPYFGASSTWDRYTYSRPGEVAPVFLDVIGTDDLRALSRYGLEACYRFHGDPILAADRVDLGGPSVARHVTYRDRATGRSWVVVSWVVPVEWPGDEPRFQRVVLLRQLPPGGDAVATTTQLTGLAEVLVRVTRT